MTVRALALEAALYVAVMLVCAELSKTTEQRLYDRLRRHYQLTHALWFLSRNIGQLALASELSYMKAAQT